MPASAILTEAKFSYNDSIVLDLIDNKLQGLSLAMNDLQLYGIISCVISQI